MNNTKQIPINKTIINIDDAVSNLVDANESIHIDIDLSDIIYDLNRLSERLENKLTK